MRRPAYPKGAGRDWWSFNRKLENDGYPTAKYYALLKFQDGEWQQLNITNLTWEEAVLLKERCSQPGYMFNEAPFMRIVLHQWKDEFFPP
jgi:hypothetical protein